MEDYVLKVAHSNPEVADRAVSTIHSKLTAKLVRMEDILQVQSGVFCGHLLHWINERQTQAEAALLAASLKMLKLGAESGTGRRALQEFGGIEFLSAYHRHAPAPLQDLISEVLTLLVSSVDRDSPTRSDLSSPGQSTYTDYASTFEPRIAISDSGTTKLYTAKATRLDLEAHPRVDEHCEYPPVLLSESDEKVLFDLTVSVKFGDEEQAIGALEETKRRICEDFPADCLLQRGDLVKAVAGLAAKSSEKQVLLVGEKCISILESLLKMVNSLEESMRVPESRPAQFLPRKLLIAAEFSGSSHPSLSLEAWQSGTPGNTLSSAGLVELVLTSIPLHEPKLLGACFRLWRTAEGFLERLAKHPFAVQQVVKQFSMALETLDKLENSQNCFLQRLTLARMLVPLVKSLPVDMLRDFIPPNSSAGQCLTEFMVFRTQPDPDLLPYLESLDPTGLKDYQTAILCSESLQRAQKVKESLSLTTGLPVTSVAMYYNTLNVLQSTLPALEFDPALQLAPAILDLNAFALVISEDSHLEARLEDAQKLLLALLTCPLPEIRENTHISLLSALQDERELGGIGRGCKRNLTIAQAVSAPQLLFHLICLSEQTRKYDILLQIQQITGGKALEAYLPFIMGESGHNARAATLFHLLMAEISDDLTVFWKYIRELFAVDSLKRKSAISVLINRSSVQSLAFDLQTDPSDLARDQEDFLSKLEEKGDLDFLELPSVSASLSDFSNLLAFLTKPALELTLKHSVLDQIVTFLLVGIPQLKSEHVNPLIVFCVEALSLEIAGSAPIINRKIVAKSLEILCVLACNYSQCARKVVEITAEVVLRVVWMTANAYSPVRFYAYYLLFVLSFSIEIPRNKVPFPQGSTLQAVNPKPVTSTRLQAISVYSQAVKAFRCPFPVVPLSPYSDPSQPPWQHIPSSARVHAYVRAEFGFDFHPALELNKLGTQIATAEHHAEILDAVDGWVNWVLLAPNGEVYAELVRTDSAVMREICSALRVPPTNRVEDALKSTLTTALSTIAKAGKGYLGLVTVFDFYATLGEILQKSLLPLLIEASGIEGREALVCSVLELLNVLLPLQDSKLENSEFKTIRVLSKFQLDANAQAKASILHLFARISEICVNPSVLSLVLESLYRVISSQPLSTALDLAASHTAQELVSMVLASCIGHIAPYTSSGCFLNKGALKRLLRVCAVAPEWVQCDGFSWCVKLTRDREAEIRELAWDLLRRLLPRSLQAHSSLIEEALMVSFGEADTYGVKTTAICFLSEVAALFGDADLASSETQQFLTQLYQQGTISHIKSLLYENAGPCSSYFAALISLLTGLLVLDSAKVLAMCNQLDLWDGIMRLMRPGALAERSSNEKRVPFQSLPSASDQDSDLTTITLFFHFVGQSMSFDPQTCAFLLESTHILSYSLQWLSDLCPAFTPDKEQVYARAVLAALNCLHTGLYMGKGRGVRAIQEEVDYAVLADWLDKVSGSEVRMAASRLFTCLLPSFDPGNEGERLILHQIGTFKIALSKGESSDIRDSIGSLISLFLHSDSAKRVALATGFDKDLCDYLSRLSANIYQDEIAKTRPKYLKSVGNSQPDVGDLTQAMMVVRAWTAGPQDVRTALAFKEDSLGPIYTAFFALWSLAVRHKKLQESLLMTISTAISECDEAKKACVILQESKQSLLSLLIDFTCRPALVSEEMYLLALRVIGNIAGNKEARQLLIKSKFAFGLAQRLVKVWSESKDLTVLPAKTMGTVTFLSTFSFYKEGQSMVTVSSIQTVSGLVDVLMEVLERYTTDVAPAELVEEVLLLVRNLGFQPATKPHIFTRPVALPLVLSLASSPSERPLIRKLAASALWSVLYGNMKVKGMLTHSEALENLTRLYQELGRDIETAQRNAKPGLNHLKDTAEAIDSVIKICTSA